mgnify:CR=1 FL=1
MPYGKPPSKLEMKAYRKAQKAVMEDPKKLEKVQVAFRKKHDYQGTKKTSVSKPKPPPIPANKGGKKIKPKPKQKRSKMYPVSTTESPDKPKKAKPTQNKEDFMAAMGVMTDLAKDKGKSTSADVDSKVALDKKAEKGKLSQKAFLEDVSLAKGYDEKNDDFYDDMFGHILDDIGANANTEAKQQRAFDRASSKTYTEIGKYRRRLFNRVIKGKKFKTFKEAQETFLKDYHYNAYFYEDD